MKILIAVGVVITVICLAISVRMSASNQKNTEPVTFDSKRYSIDASDSPWVVVNKQRPLSPSDFVPEDLFVPAAAKVANISPTESNMSKEAASSLETLFVAAKKDRVGLQLQSGYRSYSFQKNLYNRYVLEQGQSEADRESARAGYSEHQTGLAADISSPQLKTCNITQCFADTDQGRWLANNAHRYGFIVRYPQDQETVTGYAYEPWHIRYVGTYLSTEMQRTNTSTLESFFRLPNASSYKL